MVAKIGNYKGSPTISLMNGEDDKYPFTFGQKKAVLVLAHIADIKAFVARCEQNDQRKREAMDDEAMAGSFNPDANPF